MQNEVNRKEINNLKLERSVQTKIVNRKSERSVQKVINQTGIFIQKSNNILKVQDSESSYSKRIRNSEKNIEMHENDYDIKRSNGRRCNNKSITDKRG